MATYKNPINIISLNVRGIVNATKRDKMFLWFKNQNADIVLIQESHCTQSKLHRFKSSWKGKSYYELTNSAFSKGVGILFKENIDVKVTDNISFGDGRALLINAELYGEKICIVNVYAPNRDHERTVFFRDLKSWILTNAKCIESMVIGGDFNYCLQSNDRTSSTHLQDKSRQE